MALVGNGRMNLGWVVVALWELGEMGLGWVLVVPWL